MPERANTCMAYHMSLYNLSKNTFPVFPQVHVQTGCPIAFPNELSNKMHACCSQTFIKPNSFLLGNSLLAHLYTHTHTPLALPSEGAGHSVPVHDLLRASRSRMSSCPHMLGMSLNRVTDLSWRSLWPPMTKFVDRRQSRIAATLYLHNVSVRTPSWPDRSIAPLLSVGNYSGIEAKAC